MGGPQIIGPFAQDARGHGLNSAIKDDPDRHEGANHEKGRASAFIAAIGKNGVEINGDAHHKPHIPRAE